MADPVSPAAAVTVSTALTAGSASLLPDFPLVEYLVGTVFCIAGAMAWQFLAAQMAREQAALKGIAPADRPGIDWTTLAYAILGAPLASGWLLYAVHLLGGGSGLFSIGGFMLAGAAGPVVVSKAIQSFAKLTTR